MLWDLLQALRAYLHELGERRHAAKLPRYEPHTVRQAYAGPALLRGKVRSRGGLVAPLSGRPTMGFVLQVKPVNGGAPMAVGCIDALELDDGHGIAYTERQLGLVVLDTSVPHTTRPLYAHLDDPLIQNVFRARGLDLGWAQRRTALALSERCLPEHHPLWVGGVADRHPAQTRLHLTTSTSHPLLVSMRDPGSLAGCQDAQAQLRALRRDELIDALVQNAAEEPELMGFC